MALSQAQILDCLVMLGLPARLDLAANLSGVIGIAGGDRDAYRKGLVARELLEHLDATQETAVGELLTQYEAVKYSTNTIQAEGLDKSPMRARARLKRMLADIIGYTYASGGAGSITIQRG